MRFHIKSSLRMLAAAAVLLTGAAQAQVSDDFSAPALDGGLWAVVDPLGDGSVTQADGRLVLSVPGGVNHDLWSSGNQSLRIVQPLADGDFEVETKFHSLPYTPYQIQGLLVEQDAANYLRADFYDDGFGLRLFVAGMVNNAPTVFANSQAVISGTPHLRVGRAGGQWTVKYSMDGAVWVTAAQFAFPLTVTGSGVYAGNVGSPAPAYDVVVDYYFNTLSPIVPEDDGVVDAVAPTLASVTAVPGVNDAVVTFSTDEPAVGGVAYGLTPALELGSVEAPGLRLQHQITLAGLDAGTVYHFQAYATDVDANLGQAAAGDLTTLPVANVPPTATLTAPAAGSSYVSGDPIALAADASDGDGSVALVEFLADGAVIGSAAAAPWEFTWLDAPVGNHDLAARAVDDDGDTGLSASVPVTVNPPPGSPVAVSDDFSAGAFNDSLWTFVDPLGGASYVQSSGLLTLAVPGGVSHDPWEQGNNAVRIVQPVVDADMALEAKFETIPQARFQMEGLIVEQDGSNFIRFDYYHDGANLRLFAAQIIGGVATQRLNTIIPLSSALWLRLNRVGDQWTGSYSQVGQAWGQAVVMNVPLVVGIVGVFAGIAEPAPAFDAVVDYFFDQNAPIDPEDGAVVDVLPPVIAGAAVVPGVTDASFTFTTDEPALGRVRYGLTAALELGFVEGVGLQTSHALQLTGLTAETPYFYQIEAEDGSGNLAQEPAGQFSTLAVPNQLPVVALDAPLSGTYYAAGDTVFFAATASDADGVVTLVEFLANGAVVGSAAAEPYEFAWSDPAPGNYDLAARATDDVGDTATSVAATVTVAPPPGAPVAVSDDFSGPALNDSLWTWIDPKGDSSYYQANGLLEISVPAGSVHDLWDQGNTSARLVQDVADADISLDVKFESAPQLPYQIQGLLLEAAPGDYVRVDYFHDGAGLRLFGASFVGDAPTVRGNVAVPAGGPLWIRVVRTGDSFAASWSQDGDVWQLAFAFSHAMVLDSVGVYAANVGDPAPGFTAVVDYFFDNNDPIDPEDDGVVDIWSPVVTDISVLPDPLTGTALVTCTTNEPATTLVNFGLDAAYGSSAVGATVDGYAHEITLTGLTPDAVYHFSISASDTLANVTDTPDQQFLNVEIKPVITVWGGLDHRVGNIGYAQADFNLMGNVFLWENLAGLFYSVNGGPEAPLNWGQGEDDYGDYRRLAHNGDFNVDLPVDQLQMGPNTIAVRAVDIYGKEDLVVANVTRETGATTLPLFVDWENVADPQDAGQKVDGSWGIEGLGLRTLTTGYDRIFLMGEATWQDYEIVAPITIHEVLQPGPGVGGPGMGFLMRFTGHIVGGHRDWPDVQPKWGYQPFGGLGWLRWVSGITNPPTVQFYHGDYDVEENFGGAKDGAEAAVPDAVSFGADQMVTDFGLADKIRIGETFMMKMRCETLPDAPNGDGVTQYSYKVWLNTETEPVDWNFQVVQQSAYALRQGGVCLLAHHVDVSFGDVIVTNLAGVAGVGDDLPSQFRLAGNYPNPFNPMTTIAFEVPAAGRAQVRVFDIRGMHVATVLDADLQPGRHEVVWDGRDAQGRQAASGQYFYRLDAGGKTAVSKMLLLK